MKYSKGSDEPRIRRIVESTTCKKHEAAEGDACWVVRPSSIKTQEFFLGVCGTRVKRAGFNGAISEMATTSKKRK